ncbi:hypothetical protein GIB67_030138 [Kingdonia uniflora]|uniref:Uncharacterized protein n=1 Tax=Kingdonia uniflora TaxID=39325 RepID=A0A7J7L750_9MAGN|nr:hypothetical protein GIB67_030138 [Kingdonia uniflora]
MRKGEVSNLVKSLRVAAKAQTVVDLSFMVRSVIEDMTFLMLFGRKDDRFDFKPVIEEIIRLAGTFNVADYIPYIRALTSGKVSYSFATTIVSKKLVMPKNAFGLGFPVFSMTKKPLSLLQVILSSGTKSSI